MPSRVEQIELSGDWNGFDGIFGGYVIAVLGHACQIEGYTILSLGVDFSGAVRAGNAELLIDIRHAGKTTASVEVALVQGHRRASAVGKLARAGVGDDDTPVENLSAILRPEGLRNFDPPYGPMPYGACVSMRLAEPDAHGSGRTMAFWLKLDESRAQVAALDAFGRAAVLLDAVPPGLFFDTPAPDFVPTIDLTMHLPPRPAVSDDGWYLARRTTPWAADGFCMEDISLCTSAGGLVAVARQDRRVVWADSTNGRAPGG